MKFLFTVYFSEREREREREGERQSTSRRGAERERETQNPKQDPGSELSAQSWMQDSNPHCEIRTRAD